MSRHSSKEDKAPAFQFYPKDWSAEPCLRSVSLAARGLWIEMLCIMWESPRRGTLCYLDGEHQIQRMDSKRIAKRVGEDLLVVAACMAELVSEGVASSDEYGFIYSRRMRREADAKDGLSAVRAESGKAGAASRWNSKHDGKTIAKHGSPVSGLRSPDSDLQAPDSDLQVSPPPPPPEAAGKAKPLSVHTKKLQVIADWNAVAEHRKWPKVSKVPEGETGDNLNARVKDAWWLENYPRAFKKLIREMKWMTKGKLSMIVRPDAVRKIVDGDWDDKKAEHSRPSDDDPVDSMFTPPVPE